MSAIKRSTEVIEWREAGGPSVVRKLPGRTKFEPVTFEVGLTHDKQLIAWADQVNSPQGDAAMSLKNYRKDVTVEVLNLQATPVMAFTLHRAWVSEFQARPGDGRERQRRRDPDAEDRVRGVLGRSGHHGAGGNVGAVAWRHCPCAA